MEEYWLVFDQSTLLGRE